MGGNSLRRRENIGGGRQLLSEGGENWGGGRQISSESTGDDWVGLRELVLGRRADAEGRILSGVMTNSCLRCARCSRPVGDADNFCPRCGEALKGPEPTRALVPDQVRNEPAAMALLPAVRADLALFAPAMRSVAAVLATAALTDWAARHAAPALARRTRDALLERQRPKRVAETMMIEQQITVRKWISVRS